MDDVAARGFRAGAEAYQRSRPTWPLAAVDAAFEFWALDPGAGLVLDVGAGTGLLTERLAERCPRLLAVEPVAEMRAHIGAAEAVEGTAEHLPVEDGGAHAIFSAEAFHWFDPTIALAEFARALPPGGGLAVMWNRALIGPDEEAWGAELAGLLADDYYHATDQPLDAADPRELRDWEQGAQWSAFEPLTYREFAHTEQMTRATTVGRIASFSYVGALDEQRRGELLTQVDDVLARHGVEEYEQRWRCDLYLTRRLG
jgi:SAM-dependent methyltransferase